MKRKYKLQAEEINYTKKGLLIGASVAILAMFALLTWSIEIVILIVLGLTGIVFFVLPSEKSRRVFKKHKYLVFSFVLILCIVFSVLVAGSNNRQNYEGNTFSDSSNPRYNEGYLFNEDRNPGNVLDIPDDDYYYQAKTDFFGQTNFTIDLTIHNYEKDDFVRAFIMVWSYYGIDINDATLIVDCEEFELREVSENIAAKIYINELSENKGHSSISYLFKIFLEMHEDKYYEEVRADIIFESNIDDDVTYSYKKNSESLPSGDLHEGSVSGEDFLLAPDILYLYAFVILFAYIFIMVLCFVFQRFEIAKFMMIIYLLLGTIVLFWYISWGSEDPARMGLPDKGLTAIFHMSWDFSDVSDTVNEFIDVYDELGDLEVGIGEYTWGPLSDKPWWVPLSRVPDLDLDPLRLLILTIICILQWVFSVGIILIVMLYITMAFGSIFDADKANEQYEMKIAIRELAQAVNKK